MTTLLTIAGLAVATVLIAVYGAAQRFRLRHIRAQVAAARADLDRLRAEADALPTVECSEHLLTTVIMAGQNCGRSIEPHVMAADRALGQVGAISVQIGRYWTGRDREALRSWAAAEAGLKWNKEVTLTTTLTRRVPAPTPAEPTP
jgi:hypothetical protein